MYYGTPQGAGQGVGVSWATGTPLEVYTPVGVILYINPEEVPTISRTKEDTIVVNLLNNTLGIVVH
jgi:hypothetical protein